MTPNSQGSGVRTFEALTGPEVLLRIRMAFERIEAQIRALPEFGHPVTFPELDFQIHVHLTTYPLDEQGRSWTEESHVVQVDGYGIPVVTPAEPLERFLGEEFSTGAEEQMEREDGTIRVNQAPDEIREELSLPVPKLRRTGSGELVTHGEDEGEPVERAPGPLEPPRDPRAERPDDPLPVPVNPYVKVLPEVPRAKRGGPRGAVVDGRALRGLQGE